MEISDGVSALRCPGTRLLLSRQIFVFASSILYIAVAMKTCCSRSYENLQSPLTEARFTQKGINHKRFFRNSWLLPDRLEVQVLNCIVTTSMIN
jgi:hypothetical protein